MIGNIIYEELEKGDKVLFARVLPNIGYYEILELKIVSIYETYCTGTDTKTKQTYPFSRKLAETVLFWEKDRKLAIKYLKDKKRENKNIKVATE